MGLDNLAKALQTWADGLIFVTTNFMLSDILCDGKQVLFIKCEVEDCRNVCIPVSDVKYCWFHQRNTESIRHDFNVPWVSSFV